MVRAMKNLLDEAHRANLLARIDRLSTTSERRWGRMSVEQMICHVSDPLRIALGEMQVADASTFMTRTALRRLVLLGAPAPKGKVDTFPEIDQVEGGGTAPTSLDEGGATLRGRIARLVREGPENRLAPSPIFGRLSGRQYGRLMYVHMHHHLKQFGA